MPYLIWRRALYLWIPGSYCAPIPIPSEGDAVALTPPSTVMAIRSGYVLIVQGSVESFPHPTRDSLATDSQ